MRQRVEDLGRLSLLLRNLMEHELFTDEDRLGPRRPKDSSEWFERKSDEEKDEVVSSWVYGIEAIGEKLYEMCQSPMAPTF